MNSLNKMTERLEDKAELDLPKIDPDLSPKNPVNVNEAGEYGLKYDISKSAYVDCSGCPTLDRFGQPL